MPAASGERTAHEYLSTACWHAVADNNPDLHTACRNDCKFCPSVCGCECHQNAGTQTARRSRVDEARDMARALLAELRVVGNGLADIDPGLREQIQNDPALFWLRGEERPHGTWRPPGTEEGGA